MTLRVRDWNKHFETAASRKLVKLDWVAIPNKMDGLGYTTLVDHPRGASHLGSWYAIVEIASRQKKRGTLPDGPGGVCLSLARLSRLPAAEFEEAIPRLLEIGWLEQVDSIQADTENPPIIRQSSASNPPSSTTSLGDVGGSVMLCPVMSCSVSSSNLKEEKVVFFKKFDDEKPTQQKAQNRRSPEEELRAIHEEKTGIRISPDVERRIWELVELRDVPRVEFIERLRPHVPNTWENPAGFLTSFAKRINQVVGTEITIPESPPEPSKNPNGRCSACNGLGKVGDEWCTCQTGRDFHALELRSLGRKQMASAPAEQAQAKAQA